MPQAGGGRRYNRQFLPSVFPSEVTRGPSFFRRLKMRKNTVDAQSSPDGLQLIVGDRNG